MNKVKLNVVSSIDGRALCCECGGKPCICEGEDGMWAAHCMDCDNTIGRRGFYDACASTEEEAEIRWNKMNYEKSL